MALSKLREFFRPNSNLEAVALLEKYGGAALILGGGTFIHGLSARGLLSDVEVMIDTQRLPLKFVKAGKNGFQIGATTTLADLNNEEQVRNNPWLGAVKDSLQFPPAQIRNVATVGGCLASASPLFDMPVAFLALDGVVASEGPRGKREIPLDKFFVGYFESSLAQDELLTELRLPPLPQRSASAFVKLETNANDLAIVNVAVRLTLEKSGNCSEARVIFGGGVGEVPVRAASSEAVLKGKRLQPELLKNAGQAAQSDLRPLSDHRASAAYRLAVANVLVERALTCALERLG